jgi:hypothetical protein
MMFGDGGPYAGRGGQCADGQPPVGVGRMAEKQPQDLSTGISAGTSHSDRRHAAILHGYADCCKLIIRLSVMGRRAAAACDRVLQEVGGLLDHLSIRER